MKHERKHDRPVPVKGVTERSMRVVKVEMLHCLRCSHDWQPRITVRPKQCPNCRSPRWDRPRRNKVA